MPRFFIALPIGRNVVEKLANVSTSLPATGAAGPAARVAGWRWVPPESMHLTLAFLGQVAEGRVGEAMGALRNGSEGMPALDLAATGIGAFPNQNHARVLWAGVTGDLRRLRELQGALTTALNKEGFALDDRAYHPHITLARSRSAGPVPDGMDRTQSFGSWLANEVVLYESRLEPAGARYLVRAAAGLDDKPAGA